MDRSAFRQELEQSGLLGDEAVSRRLSDASAAHLDGPALARLLVQDDAITPFQANQLLTHKGRELLLEPYILQERLGQGGMGQVFKAVHRRLGRVVAIKILSPHLLKDARAAARFQREIEICARMSHPHIVQALDAAEQNGLKYLVMEYVAGADLGKLVKEIGPLPLEMACHCIHQAALGLQYAHENGLVHRDLKPTNLILQRRWEHSRSKNKRRLVYGKVKLLDLGLVGFLGRDGETATPDGLLTQVQEIMGTPDYMAPEQARDGRLVSPRTDIYSLGATLYFCLVGQPPFPEGTPLEKLMRHQTDEPTAVEKLRPEVTPRLARLVRRMMAKDPEQRPRTVAEVVAELQNWKRPPTVLIPAPPPQEVKEASQAEGIAGSEDTPGSSAFSTLEIKPEDARLVRDAPLAPSDSLLWYVLILGAVAMGLVILLVLRTLL